MKNGFDWLSFIDASQKIADKTWDLFAQSSDNMGPFNDLIKYHKKAYESVSKISEHLDPYDMQTICNDWVKKHYDLMHYAILKVNGSSEPPVAKDANSDKRFKDATWSNNLLFDCLKQIYLINSEMIQVVLDKVPEQMGVPHKQMKFYAKLMLDAMSPSNFPLTNPTVWNKTIESGGENLLKGMHNFYDDLQQAKDQWIIRMHNKGHFNLGENIAATKGKVIYRNRLMELIQYEPTTPKVYSIPILIIPPWVKKYYVFDLSPENSMVKWLVDQGFTVFIMSWICPDKNHKDNGIEEYMQDGVLQALSIVYDTLGKDQGVHLVGYCVGGILLAITLAYLAASKDLKYPITSATYFTTLTNFKNVGDLSVFIDEEQVTALEEKMFKQGYLDAATMTLSFNAIRANEMLWSFFINNYLLGKDPASLDFLYWNAEALNMPAKLHSFLLRELYLNNNLCKKGAIKIDGKSIDLGAIKIPAFMLSTIDDHIAPWDSTYIGTQLFGGKVKFVLGGSGHVAGVINSPHQNKYCYWVMGNDYNPTNPKDWLRDAIKHQGSWWGEWQKWLLTFGDQMISKRSIKNPIEDAPGSYAKTPII